MNQIIYKLEGPAETGGHLELSVFAAKIAKFHNLLAEIAKDLEKSDLEFRVVHLSHASPAAITCELAGTEQSLVNVVWHIQEIFGAIKAGQTERVSKRVLNAFERFAKTSARKIFREEVQFVANGDKSDAHHVDDEFRANLTKAQNPYTHLPDSCISTVEGKLDSVNFRNGANTFRIHNSIFSVEGRFTEDMAAQVQKALKRYVSVSGRCHYKHGASFPHAIDVHKMEILPQSSELPSFEDIYGIMPALPGGKSSEDFVREIRDKWGERDKKLYGDR